MTMASKVMMPMGALPRGSCVECLSTWVSSSKGDDDKPTKADALKQREQPHQKSNLYIWQATSLQPRLDRLAVDPGKRTNLHNACCSRRSNRTNRNTNEADDRRLIGTSPSEPIEWSNTQPAATTDLQGCHWRHIINLQGCGWILYFITPLSHHHGGQQHDDCSKTTPNEFFVRKRCDFSKWVKRILALQGCVETIMVPI